MLRALLDEARDGLVALDEHGTIVEANDAAGALLHHESKRLIGKPLAALLALEGRKSFREAFARLDGRSRATLDLSLLTDGADCRVSLHRVKGTSPPVVAVSLCVGGTVSGRTERRDAEERLARFVLRLPYGVVMLRPDLRVAFANVRARSLLGRETLRTGAPFPETAATDLRVLARRLIRVTAPLRATDVELRDGRTLRVTGLPASGNEPAVLFLEDVTEQHQAARVTREFLRNAAHQLRTPLAGITAAVETLESGAKDQPEERDRFLSHIQTHAARLTRLARGLLLLARMETGEALPLYFVELEPLLDQIVSEAEPRHGVGLAAQCPRGLSALATPELLQETLAALVDNAVAHTYEGEIRIAAERRNGSVTVSVSDTGPGILPEFRDRIFEPFFRVEASGDSYGLGLAIARQAVQAMHGEIDVSSLPGAGTTFSVTLPAATVVE